jgi:acetyl-CoA C-acetyltransferase
MRKLAILGAEGIKIETACSSGGSALRAGLVAVASGEMDCVLVVGVDKMTDDITHQNAEHNPYARLPAKISD